MLFYLENTEHKYSSHITTTSPIQSDNVLKRRLDWQHYSVNLPGMFFSRITLSERHNQKIKLLTYIYWISLLNVAKYSKENKESNMQSTNSAVLLSPSLQYTISIDTVRFLSWHTLSAYGMLNQHQYIWSLRALVSTQRCFVPTYVHYEDPDRGSTEVLRERHAVTPCPILTLTARAAVAHPRFLTFLI